MPGDLRMTKGEMALGLTSGRRLIQEEWAHPLEILWVDELVADGVAAVTPWKYDSNFQCERRNVTGAPVETPGDDGSDANG